MSKVIRSVCRVEAKSGPPGPRVTGSVSRLMAADWVTRVMSVLMMMAMTSMPVPVKFAQNGNS